MNKIIPRLVLLVLAFALLSSAAFAGGKPSKFMLLYSNNVNGEIEPCG
jgi:hypothetical protein